MKKIRKISVLLLAALLMAVSGAACSKDSDSSSSKPADSTPTAVSTSEDTSKSEEVSVTGKWIMKLDEAKYDEVFASYDEEAKKQGKALVQMMNMSIELKDDGTALCDNAMSGGTPLQTTWTKTGDMVNIAEAKREVSGNSMGIEAMTFKLEGDKLIPQSDDDMMKSVYFVKG